jgi:hypothetical protein
MEMALGVALPVELRSCREQLSAMVVDLQVNRAVLDRLSIRCSMFRFTGGALPAEPLRLTAMNSYLACPPAVDCIANEDVERYFVLIGTLVELQRGVATAERPRSLRQRHAVTDALARASSEILSIASGLESAMTSALEAPQPTSAVYETSSMPAAASVELIAQ